MEGVFGRFVEVSTGGFEDARTDGVPEQCDRPARTLICDFRTIVSTTLRVFRKM